MAPWGEDELGNPFRKPRSMLDSLGRGSEGNALRIFSSLGSQFSRSVNIHAMLGFSTPAVRVRISFSVCLIGDKITAKV